MNDPTILADRLSHALRQPSRGVVGLVDELLEIARDATLELTWESGACRIEMSTPRFRREFEQPLPKPVFRAALARVAALCNEHTPQATSPYGGRGEIVTPPEPSRTIAVEFVNTGEAQSLLLSPQSATQDSPNALSCP